MFDDYKGENTCWVNYDATVAMIELGPIAVLAAVCIIISEATGMRKFPENLKVRPML